MMRPIPHYTKEFLMITQKEFLERRKRLMKDINKNAIVILPASPIMTRNGDYEYPYRQQSDFYYLTGFEEPESVLVLNPGGGNGEFLLFNRVRNREEEIWTGYRAGLEGAVKNFGADEAYAIHEFQSKLPELLEGRDEIYYTLGMNRHFDKVVLGSVNKIRSKIRNGLHSPVAFIDVIQKIHEMRLIKSEAEIALMRASAKIGSQAHVRAIKACKPGMYEYQLEAELMYEFQQQGARFPAYTPIVGSGANSCILHYNDNNKLIADQSIVLIDAGCEYQYYASDITRTFPANGVFSKEQRAIYEIVLEAQLAGIEAIRPNAPWDAAQNAIVKVITEGLKNIGLLKGDVKDLIEKQAYFPYYMHKSGHWLGLDVHDAGRYKVDGLWRKLQPGMVLTVEPGIYLSADILGLDTRWHHIGVRIEDDVLVTENGYEILSKDVPKKIEDIEQLMKK